MSEQTEGPGPTTPNLPEAMRAAVTTRHGGVEVIELREVPVPRPGPDKVLVRVTAAACNNTDLWTREGSYRADTPAGGADRWDSHAFRAVTWPAPWWRAAPESPGT